MVGVVFLLGGWEPAALASQRRAASRSGQRPQLWRRGCPAARSSAAPPADAPRHSLPAGDSSGRAVDRMCSWRG